MATLINLNDLLRHEILDLYSAEEQIIDALPKMIEKANNGSLKKALNDHLKVTEQQKNRLDKVKQLLGDNTEDENAEENKGFFSRLFGGTNQKCRGTEGLIEEGEKMMAEDMSPEALDAAIIASAQKIEHYEICGYGTARAYARELNLVEVAGLLTQTLNEEYQADDLLTQLAVGRLNIEAEYANGVADKSNGSGNGRSASKARGNGKSSNGQSRKSTSSKRKASKTKSGNKLVKNPGSSSKRSASNSKTAKRGLSRKSSVSSKLAAGKSTSRTSARSNSSKKATSQKRKTTSKKTKSSGRR